MKNCLKILFTLLVILSLTSCNVFNKMTGKTETENAEAFSSKVERLEVGMTKQEVVSILGNDYILIRPGSYEAVLKKSVEIIRYVRKYPEQSYSIRFANGKLHDITRI